MGVGRASTQRGGMVRLPTSLCPFQTLTIFSNHPNFQCQLQEPVYVTGRGPEVFRTAEIWVRGK